jgi:hypothetical protein
MTMTNDEKAGNKPPAGGRTARQKRRPPGEGSLLLFETDSRREGIQREDKRGANEPAPEA